MHLVLRHRNIEKKREIKYILVYKKVKIFIYFFAWDGFISPDYEKQKQVKTYPSEHNLNLSTISFLCLSDFHTEPNIWLMGMHCLTFL